MSGSVDIDRLNRADGAGARPCIRTGTPQNFEIRATSLIGVSVIKQIWAASAYRFPSPSPRPARSRESSVARTTARHASPTLSVFIPSTRYRTPRLRSISATVMFKWSIRSIFMADLPG